MKSGQLLTRFVTRFGREPEIYRAPGRVNLIGEHCDYNDGFVLPCNTGLYTHVAIAPRTDHSVQVRSVLFRETSSFELDALAPGRERRWSDYVKGVYHVLDSEGLVATGADIVIDGDVPLGGGLSSSASLELALATAILCSGGHRVPAERIARLCRRAENDFVGVPCGIMDQYVIALCARGAAMKLDCRSLDYRLLPLPADLRVLVVDTGVHHQLVEGGFEQRHEECRAAAAAFDGKARGSATLRDVSQELLEEHRERLPEKLYRRARHVVSEIQRVHAAEQALGKCDLAALGALMNASHASLRDDFQVSCEELDVLTDIARKTPGVHGARMVGAGFGGCAIAVTSAGAVDAVADNVCRSYARWAGQEPWWHIACPADQAGPLEAR